MEKSRNNLNDAISGVIQEAKELADRLRVSQEEAVIREKARADRVRSLNLPNMPLEKEFDDFMLVVAAACGTPHASISVLDESFSYIKALYGFDYEIIIPRSESICDVCISKNSTLVIEDPKSDPLVNWRKPVAVNDLKFYAGTPLVSDDGFSLGVVCVFDFAESHKPTPKQIEILEAISRMITNKLIVMIKNPSFFNLPVTFNLPV
jgi:GAF domain-containing protein